MKTIKTLIKVQQQKLDVVRRNLVSLESQKAQLENLSKNLDKIDFLYPTKEILDGAQKIDGDSLYDEGQGNGA